MKLHLKPSRGNNSESMKARERRGIAVRIMGTCGCGGRGGGQNVKL